MKIAKNILIWVAVALIIQLPIYYLADRYIMIKENIRIYKKDLSVVEDKMTRSINLSIKGKWKNVDISYNGKYISYKENNVLNIKHMDNNERIQIPFKDGQQLAYYSWIPQRDRMLIIEKEVKGKEAVFSINYYDAVNKEKIRVKDISHEENPAYINDVEISLLTGIIYVNIVHKGDRSSLYRIDISENIFAIDTKEYFIDKLCLVASKDRLLYEDKLYDKIFYLDFPSNEGKEIKIKGEDQLALLGCDEEGMVYIGGLENGKVKNIYYGRGDEELDSFKVINLDTFVEEKNVYVNNKGGIYLVDKLENTIIFINGHIQTLTHLDGEFIDFYNQGYIYKDTKTNTIKNEFLGQSGHN